jgi:succinate-acetate transporter protein
MTDEQPAEKKVGYAAASLVCSIMASLIAVGAWYALYVWIVGIFVSVLMVFVVVSLLVPIFALAIFSFDGSRQARRLAIVAMVLGVFGPVGGCAGGYYALMAAQPQRTTPATTPP